MSHFKGCAEQTWATQRITYGGRQGSLRFLGKIAILIKFRPFLEPFERSTLLKLVVIC